MNETFIPYCQESEWEFSCYQPNDVSNKFLNPIRGAGNLSTKGGYNLLTVEACCNFVDMCTIKAIESYSKWTTRIVGPVDKKLGHTPTRFKSRCQYEDFVGK